MNALDFFKNYNTKEGVYAINWIKENLNINLDEKKEKFIKYAYIKDNDCRPTRLTLRRQGGKTYLLSCMAIERFLNSIQKEICITCSSSMQIKYFKDIICNLLNNYIEEHDISDSDFDNINARSCSYIRNKINGTIIRFISNNTYNNARGMKFDYVFIDEVDYISNDFFIILQSSILSTNGKIICAGTNTRNIINTIDYKMEVV